VRVHFVAAQEQPKEPLATICRRYLVVLTAMQVPSAYLALQTISRAARSG
jgi:hypothetical protein